MVAIQRVPVASPSTTPPPPLAVIAALLMSATSEKQLKPLRVFVVDDSMLNRRMLKNSLQLDGHTCEEAEDGLEAVSRIVAIIADSAEGTPSSKQFDAILIDNHMPRMNGTTATQEMRRRGYAGVIIGITGDDDELTKQEFLTAGANGCLVKPISHDGLVACLATHLMGQGLVSARTSAVL